MPLQRYVATRDAEAGDRRRPHVLALGVDLRDAAGPGARAARDGGAATSTRPASPTCAGTCATAATGAAPGARGDADRAAAADAARRRARATAGPRCCSPSDGEAPRRGAGEVRIRQRAIGVNYLDVYLRTGWIPAMLPLPAACRAWRRPARSRRRRRRAAASCPATASPTSARCPAPTAACARVPAEWVVRLPAGDRRRRRRGDCC